MSLLRKVLDVLTPRERRQLAWLAPVTVAMALAEVAAIAALGPFLALVAEPEAARAHGILRWAYDAFGFERDVDFLLAVGLVALIALLVGNAILTVGNWALFTFGAMRNHSLSRRLLIRYLQQPYAFFLERNTAGLAGTILHEVSEVIRRVVVPGLLAVAKAVTAAALVGFLFALEPYVALGIGGVLAGTYATVFLATRRHLARMGAERVGLNQERYASAAAALGGIKALKVLGREADAVARFTTPSYLHARYEARQEVLVRLPRYVLEAIALGGLIVVILVLVSSGWGVGSLLPLLGVYAFGGYRTLLALYDVFEGISQVRYGRGALDEVHGFLRAVDSGPEDPEAFAPRSIVPRVPLQSELRLQDVGFRYPHSARPQLQGIDLRIPAGASVALVGATGSGKTTLVDLLVGLLPPDEGRILVDGDPLEGLRLQGWQRSLGYAPQDVFVLDASVEENIALGVPPDQVDRHAVTRAARAAHIDHLLAGEPFGNWAASVADGRRNRRVVLEEGAADGAASESDRSVGERGSRLSGGQRQRIGIARALYGDPDVVVLDEATSALDADTERRVLKAVRRAERPRTVIAVSHRLASVADFDLMVLLEDGRVADRGTFRELLERSSRFRSLATVVE